jgi:uncharacterized protein
MLGESPVARHRESVLQRHPVASYFALTFAVSWIGALLVAAPYLLRGETIPKMSGLLMFPVMLVGPSLVGILMTRFTLGKEGLRNLFGRMARIRVPARWYAVLLIPPALLLTVLFALEMFWSPIFAPNNFWVGVSFGCIAGFFEEIGWTGYAFPEMSARRNGFTSAILLGVLWGLWHLPVVDYLGTATPHGAYWFRFFLAFTAAMTAMRVLISWLSARTNSVALAQLMHAVSTGSLVVFSPPGVSAAQETTWYAVYAVTLWLAVAVLAVANHGVFQRKFKKKRQAKSET